MNTTTGPGPSARLPFDRATVERAIALSQAVYSQTVPPGVPCIQHTPIVDKETHTAIGVYETVDTLWLAVKGSTNHHHWWSNLHVWKRPFHGLMAHAGFARAAEHVLTRVRSMVHRHPDHRVMLTGHSRGGAIAVLLAAGLLYRRPGIITVGQPPVANGRELESVLAACDYLRLVNGSDAVPRWPKIGYGHDGHLLYFNNDGSCSANPGMWQRAKDRFFRALALERVTDHYASDYKEEFKSCDIL